MSDYNPFSLKDRVILVTGASSGLGKATAIACSRMGARLVCCGRNEARLQETMGLLEGEGHEMFIGDLAQDECITGLVSSLGQLNGVFLSAGIGHAKPFSFTSRKELDYVLNTNFYAPVELLRMLGKKKKLAAGASVVFLSSIGGTLEFCAGNTAYGISKAALLSVVKFCANEFSARKIRVNAICPGMVHTPMVDCGFWTEEQLSEEESHYLLKRFGQPEDVAHAALYLLSDASSWMTGQGLVLDGGRTLVR